MRHKKKGNHLGRTASHKKALMRNMAAQVIEHKEIRTTVAKAKELRQYVERLITYGKKGSVHHRRLAFKFLQNKYAVTTLFDEIAPAFDAREGGYTRIIKLGKRKGDAASLSVFQLVGFEKGGEASKSKPKVDKKEKAVKDKAATQAPVKDEVVKEVQEEIQQTADTIEESDVEVTAVDKQQEEAEEAKMESPVAENQDQSEVKTKGIDDNSEEESKDK